MSARSGMTHAPRGKQEPVVEPGEFLVAAIGLDHGHIIGMCYGLMDAGAQIVAVYDPDPKKVESFRREFSDAKVAASPDEILEDERIHMVASSIVPSERGPLGLKVQAAGKHYFVDKAPFTTLDQVAAARRSVKETGKVWGICYSERLQNEAAVCADGLVADGAIGRVIQVIGLGPHRLQAQDRPGWFFEKKTYGGILIDLGSHQIEQFLFYAGAKSATITSSRVANYNHPEYPELDDFGDAALVADTGVTSYFRVDWFTPDGLSTWGDGRTIILGTDGYIELRKNLDVAREASMDHVYLVNGKEELHLQVTGRYGFPYFGRLILDCLEGTERAMTQEHAFTAAELCIKVQEAAVRVAG